MNEDIKKEIREIIHTYCGGNYENRRMATELILQKCQEKQLTLTDVVKQSELFFCCKDQIKQGCSEQCLGCYMYANDKV